jgi:hypothetical protein
MSKKTKVTVYRSSLVDGCRKTHHSIQLRGKGAIKGMKENNHVFVDEFSSKIPFHKKNVFFLTHFHNDHLRGLKNKKFQNLVYCTRVTAKLLHNDPLYQHVRAKVIPFKKTTRLIFGSFTFLPANHGVGSCMIFFIFKYPTLKRVLLTGDFRASLDLTKNTRDFLKRGKHFGKVDSLYIDNTFADANHWTFATYVQSAKLLTNFVDQQQTVTDHDLGKFEYFYLDTNAKIGYEPLWKALNVKFKERIHVNDFTFQLLKTIPGVSNLITTNPDTPFHSCGGGDTREKYCDFLQSQEKKLIVNIIPSARYFQSKKNEAVNMDNWIVQYKPSIFGICYATHSSMSELKHFVTECGFKTKRYN